MLKEGVWDAVKKGWQSATNKITQDKLDMNWRRNRGDNNVDGPVEQQEVIDFLKKMGVTDHLVNKVFTDLKIPMSAEVTPGSAEVPQTRDNQAQTPSDDTEQTHSDEEEGASHYENAMQALKQITQNDDRKKIMSFLKSEWGLSKPVTKKKPVTKQKPVTTKPVTPPETPAAANPRGYYGKTTTTFSPRTKDLPLSPSQSRAARRAPKG